jgi:hypothetical protein
MKTGGTHKSAARFVFKGYANRKINVPDYCIWFGEYGFLSRDVCDVLARLPGFRETFRVQGHHTPGISVRSGIFQRMSTAVFSAKWRQSLGRCTDTGPMVAFIHEVNLATSRNAARRRFP